MDEELDDITTRLNKVKIKFGDTLYNNLIKKYNIQDPPIKETEQEKYDEYQIVLDILDSIEDYENNMLDEEECEEMIEFGMAKIMQYQRRIDFSPFNTVNMMLKPEHLKMHTKIGKMIKGAIPILKSGKVAKSRKIKNIKNVNSLIVKLTESLYDDQNGVDDITHRLHKIQIKKKQA